MIEVDPKIEQTFAEVLSRSRHRAADISERLAAQQRAMEERSKQILEEGKALSEELDRRVAEKETAQQNPWQTRESKPTVLAFGDEDEDGRKPVPAQPPAVTPSPAAAYPPVPEPEPPAAEPGKRFLSFEVEEEDAERPRPAPPQPTRPAAAGSDDEDDDYSGRSWVR